MTVKRDLSSADYWRSIGTNEAEIPGLVAWEIESRQRDAATKVQDAQELASLAWAAVNDGQLSPHDAHALLLQEGKSEAAEAFHAGWDVLDAASNLEDGLAVLRGMSASEHREWVAAQKAAAERDEYARRYAETEKANEASMEAAIAAAKGYGALAEQVVDRLANKITTGAIGDVTPESITAETHTAGREVAIANDRLETLREQARTEFRIRSREEARTGGLRTSSDRAAAERAYIAARVEQLAGERPLTAEEVAAAQTPEEARREHIDRVQDKATFSKDFDRNAAGMIERGRALEAERKRPRSLLAGRFGNPPAPDDEVVIA